MSLPGIVIFALTYLVISSKRGSWLTLDRPAAALLGAVACVASGVLSPRVALEAVDGSTLCGELRRVTGVCLSARPGVTTRAGDGNRTRIASLEGWNSAIELHPRRS